MSYVKLQDHERKFLKNLREQRKLSAFARKVSSNNKKWKVNWKSLRVMLIRYQEGRPLTEETYAKLKPYLPSKPNYEHLQHLASQLVKDKDPDQEKAKRALFVYLQDQLRTAFKIHEQTIKRGWSPAQLAHECYRIMVQPDDSSPELVLGDLRIQRAQLKLDKLPSIQRDKLDKLPKLQRTLQKLIEEALLWGPRTLDELVLIAQALETSPQKLFVPQPDAARLLREVMRLASGKPVERLFDELAKILGIADEVRKL